MNEFNEAVQYLKEKKVPFAVKQDFRNNTISIVGVTLSKEGKFFRANGKIIAGNFVSLLSKFV